MKAIKEEWTYDPKTGKQIFVDRDKAIKDKTANFKRVNLDEKKSKPVVTAAKPKVAKKLTGTEKLKELVKKEKSERADIEEKIYRNMDPDKKDRAEALKQADEYIASKKVPDDTHRTIDEIVDLAWKKSKKTREHFQSPISFRQALIKNKKLRDLYDQKLIENFGHKAEDEKKAKKASTAEKVAKLKEKVELETDVNKIADWFWNNRKDKSFKVLFPDVDSLATLSRLIRNDDRGTKFFAKIMRDHGYRKAEEKPVVRKAVIVKKHGDAALDWEREGNAAKEFEEKDSDAIWNNVKSFFTSWAKEFGYKLTPEALNKFKENVYKSIVYYNTMYILRGNK